MRTHEYNQLIHFEKPLIVGLEFLVLARRFSLKQLLRFERVALRAFSRMAKATRRRCDPVLQSGKVSTTIDTTDRTCQRFLAPQAPITSARAPEPDRWQISKRRSSCVMWHSNPPCWPHDISHGTKVNWPSLQSRSIQKCNQLDLNVHCLRWTVNGAKREKNALAINRW